MLRSAPADPCLFLFLQSERFGFIPVRAIWGCVFVAITLGLLSLIASAASSALFSLAVAGNNLAWGLPIFARAVWGRDKFQPGAFYTGKYFSLPIAWAAIIFLVFGIILAMFPDGGPDPTPQSMNYTVVINMAVWGGCSLYYLVDARKWFTGPKTTVDDADEIIGQVVQSEKTNDTIAGKDKEAEAKSQGVNGDEQAATLA